MATLALFRTNSGLSSYGYEKAPSLEGVKRKNVKLFNLPSRLRTPIAQASGTSTRSMFAKAAQHLRKFVSAVQKMGCATTCDSHSQEPNNPRLHSGTYIQEKHATPESGVWCDTPTLGFAEQTKGSSEDSQPQVSWVELRQNSAHISPPSTNVAYKSSVLFSDETLQFANAFLPSMEPLEIWEAPTPLRNSDEPPSMGWVRRRTCIRPGNVIQTPSVSGRSGIYLLSSKNEPGWQTNLDLSTENHLSPKLFIAQVGGAKRPIGYSQAFIMCKPDPEFQ